uniref:EF-hand domain-containing protein n=1 Tax=Steinernema glaseri TaxID=37863 RepID=A0A1I7YHA9_9BILA
MGLWTGHTLLLGQQALSSWLHEAWHQTRLSIMLRTADTFDAVYYNTAGSFSRTVDLLEFYEIIISSGKNVSFLSIKERWPNEDASQIYHSEEGINIHRYERIKKCVESGELTFDKIFDHMKRKMPNNTTEEAEMQQMLSLFLKRGDTLQQVMHEFESTRSELVQINRQIFSYLFETEKNNSEQSSVFMQPISNGHVRPIRESAQSIAHIDASSTMHPNTKKSLLVCSPRGCCCIEYQFMVETESEIQLSLEINYKVGLLPQHFERNLIAVIYDCHTSATVTVTSILGDAAGTYLSEKTILEPGEYCVQLRNCVDVADEPTSYEVALTNDKGKMSKDYRMALLNVFDIFDLNDNGTICSGEFCIYTLLTGDEKFSKEEWTALTDVFDTRNGELTMKAFIEYHQVEISEHANGNEDLLCDIWTSLKHIGFDRSLAMVTACPSYIKLTSMGEPIELVDPAIRWFNTFEDESFAEYAYNHPQSMFLLSNNEITIKKYRCDYYAVVVKPESSLNKVYRIGITARTSLGTTSNTLHSVNMKGGYKVGSVKEPV